MVHLALCFFRLGLHVAQMRQFWFYPRVGGVDPHRDWHAVIWNCRGLWSEGRTFGTVPTKWRFPRVVVLRQIHNHETVVVQLPPLPPASSSWRRIGCRRNRDNPRHLNKQLKPASEFPISLARSAQAIVRVQNTNPRVQILLITQRHPCRQRILGTDRWVVSAFNHFFISFLGDLNIKYF